MPNSERTDDVTKPPTSSKTDDLPNSLALSDTCLLNEPPSSSNKKKFIKHQSSSSFGGISNKHENKKGIKQKIVNKVMAWNSSKSSSSKDFDKDNLSVGTDGLPLAQEVSEENLCKPDWLRARDSLENLIYNRNDKTKGEIMNSKSTPFSQEKSLGESSPHSEAAIGNKPCSQSIAKVLNWDPWDKLGRKNKRDNKQRRKSEKNTHPMRDTNLQAANVESSRKDHTSGDEIRQKSGSPEERNEDDNIEENYETYEYQPYAKNSKSVDFTNEVVVVHFTGEEVVGQSKEPLKKELDQQIRNKEMRKGHCPAMLSKRRPFCDDYMAMWFKR